MSNGPSTATPDAPPLWQMWRDLADQGARLAAVERSVPELAARLEGRVAALDSQLGRQSDHLAQQDQQQATFRLDMKSTLGTLASGLGTLQQAEQQRAEDAREVERRHNAQAVALAEEARVRHVQAASRVRQTVAGVATFAAGQVGAEIAGLPLRVRLLCLAGGAVVALGWVLLDYLRTRPHRTTP